MSRHSKCQRAFALGVAFFLLSLSNVSAHCFVGARFFPATLAIDDPCVADELSLPTVGWSKTGDVPPATEWNLSAEISKRITPDLGISIGEGWTQIRSLVDLQWQGSATLKPRYNINCSRMDRTNWRCFWA